MNSGSFDLQEAISGFRALSKMEFDSQVFGFPFFRVNLDEQDALPEEIERLKTIPGKKFGCDAKTDFSENAEFIELKRLGFHHICDQTTCKAYIEASINDGDTEVMTPDAPEEKLVSSHSANFTDDRLSLDPRIPVDTTKRFYAQWIRNSFVIPQKKTYVLDSGICITVEKDGVLKIDLVSVLEKRSGIGFRLLSHVLSEDRNNQVKTVQVTTESHNEGALRLYEKHGFRKVSEHHCLHFFHPDR